jgi:hypothetical protein
MNERADPNSKHRFRSMAFQSQLEGQFPHAFFLRVFYNNVVLLLLLLLLLLLFAF